MLAAQQHTFRWDLAELIELHEVCALQAWLLEVCLLVDEFTALPADLRD